MREDDKFCSKCGHEVILSGYVSSISSQRVRSRWWYLLPIFLDVIGGIIAYFVLRDDDKRLAKNCLVLGIILSAVYVAIWAVAYYSGGTEFPPNVMPHDDAYVTISKGTSSNQDCVTANNCYSPSDLTISKGTTVHWTNNDLSGHTVTSGRPSDSQTGTIFDSSLISAGKSYSFTFEDTGTYDYFCQVHPWMSGQITVNQNTSSPL